jgi:hypothetical protein
VIRKLKILIAHKERELRSCDPRSRDKVRAGLARLRVALLIARQERVQSNTERSALGLRSTNSGGAA